MQFDVLSLLLLISFVTYILLSWIFWSRYRLWWQWVDTVGGIAVLSFSRVNIGFALGASLASFPYIIDLMTAVIGAALLFRQVWAKKPQAVSFS
jgi:hypothetical protein